LQKEKAEKDRLAAVKAAEKEKVQAEKEEHKKKVAEKKAGQDERRKLKEEMKKMQKGIRNEDLFCLRQGQQPVCVL